MLSRREEDKKLGKWEAWRIRACKDNELGYTVLFEMQLQLRKLRKSKFEIRIY